MSRRKALCGCIVNRRQIWPTNDRHAILLKNSVTADIIAASSYRDAAANWQSRPTFMSMVNGRRSVRTTYVRRTVRHYCSQLSCTQSVMYDQPRRRIQCTATAKRNNRFSLTMRYRIRHTATVRQYSFFNVFQPQGSGFLFQHTAIVYFTGTGAEGCSLCSKCSKA